MLLTTSKPDGMRSTYPSCSSSAALDKRKPKRNVRRSDEPLRAIPNGMYMRILFTKSGGSNELSMYLREGCRSATGIIVAATIRAIEGARSRRRRRGCESSFKGEVGPRGSATSVDVLKQDLRGGTPQVYQVRWAANN